MNLSEITVAGFQLSHLLVAFMIVATFFFVLYWLWNWPCGNESNGNDDEETCRSSGPRTSLPTLTPVYATEIEPGIVILQSEDGEFFRILREYDAADKTGHGSTSPELSSSESGNRYMLSYTRAHYQTRPSAPLYPSVDVGARSDQFGGVSSWKPINTRNSRYD
jgi:hypothetical protein